MRRRGGECDANDCEFGDADDVDICADVGAGFNTCVCAGFRDVAAGTRLACPMGLTCSATGCDAPGVNGTPFATMVLLKAAMGL